MKCKPFNTIKVKIAFNQSFDFDTEKKVDVVLTIHKNVVNALLDCGIHDKLDEIAIRCNNVDISSKHVIEQPKE